jgi:hypothetical protein
MAAIKGAAFIKLGLAPTTSEIRFMVIKEIAFAKYNPGATLAASFGSATIISA